MGKERPAVVAGMVGRGTGRVVARGYPTATAFRPPVGLDCICPMSVIAAAPAANSWRALAGPGMGTRETGTAATTATGSRRGDDAVDGVVVTCCGEDGMLLNGRWRLRGSRSGVGERHGLGSRSVNVR